MVNGTKHKRVVIANRLNVRSSPDLQNDNIIGTLRFGEVLDCKSTLAGNSYMRFVTIYYKSGSTAYVWGKGTEPLKGGGAEALTIEALNWFKTFKFGAGKEYDEPFSSQIEQMWKSIGLNLTGKDTDVPWSAAFVSYCVRECSTKYKKYENFKFSAAHSRYVHDAIKSVGDVEKPFWGYPINVRKPEVGDIVCESRAKSGVTFSYAEKHDAFKSHCDIVVAVFNGTCYAVGGNVSDSVSLTKYKLDANGFLVGNKVYALLKNKVNDSNVYRVKRFVSSDSSSVLNEIIKPDGSKEVQLIGDWKNV